MIRQRKAQATAVFAALTALPSGPACAHVKWFADCEITKAPMPIGDVLSGAFTSCLLVSAAVVFLFLLVDRYMYRHAFLAGVDRKLRTYDGLSIDIVRVSASVFFFSLWLYGKSDRTGAILMTGLNFLALVTTFILYYSLHRVAYGA
jgi:hypothetical protein